MIHSSSRSCSWKHSYIFVSFSLTDGRAAHPRHWTSLINPDLRCDTKLIVLNALGKKNNSILWECTKNSSEFLSIFLDAGREPWEITKTWEKNRSRSRNGVTGPWPKAPSLMEGCCQCQRYWGTQHQEQFSACPGQPGGFPSCLKSRRKGENAERVGIVQPREEKFWGDLIVAF